MSVIEQRIAEHGLEGSGLAVMLREQTEVDERERRAGVLEAAALEIEVRGWCQGVMEDKEGRVCMIGAVYAIDSAYWLPSVWDWTGPENGECEQHWIADWNDVCPDRTATEVCFVLRWRAQEIRDGR